MKRTTFLLLSGLFATVAAHAADIEVKSAWVRGTVPAQMVTGAFMDITSKNEAALIGVSTPVADEAEVHEMRTEGGVMKMRSVSRLALPAGKAVSLKPGGYHIMLLGLKRQLKPGERVPISLSIENADKKTVALTITVEVRELGSPSAAEDHGHMH